MENVDFKTAIKNHIPYIHYIIGHLSEKLYLYYV